MGMPRKLKHFNMYGDGNDWRGEVKEITLPKLARKMEAYRGGGMGGEVDVDLGQEKLEAEIAFGGLMLDVFRNFGSAKAGGTLLRFAGSYQDDDTGEVIATEVVMRGRYTEIDMGGAKAGDDTEHKVKASLTYYKLIANGEELVEIDMLGMVEKFGGVDRLAEHRRAIGLA
ncbi:phage major tail tube protein [Crenobacter sp. SG2303]|uniref:Phage major tail tube protein n=1 Tax=Crenobacter oryzisoli TaxID=3056844 RepID=A0ABT7XP87_9NEIS|nr:phage major tail tube protein [Crenobacter sp. SG2303]MDN0075606.1 phage major tail tube protein [Crenobacter sp. SG2303]